MKKFWKEFVLRGFVACGFGPIILAIIYGVLGAAGVAETLTPEEVCKGVLSIALIAFLAGGVTAVYQMEELPLFMAILIHGIALYLDYLMLYLVNGWIAEGVQPLLIFTGIFVLGYAITWAVIYAIIRKDTQKVNRYLTEK
jgi:hypothetical protein